VRGSGLARSLLRTLFSLCVLVAVIAAMTGTAGAATIASWIGGKASVPQVVTAAGNCPGTVIMITGSGFVTDGGPVTVTIGGTPSPQVIVGSDQYVYALVGSGTQTGPVVVTTKAGSFTAPGGNAIVYPCQSTATATLAPVISSVAGHATVGKKVKILGANFVGTTGVTVGGTKTQYAIPSDGLMYVIVPTGTKAGSTQIAVTNNKGTTKASTTVTG
jgi:hypothetical protein